MPTLFSPLAQIPTKYQKHFMKIKSIYELKNRIIIIIYTNKSVQVTLTLMRSPWECPQLIMDITPNPVQTKIKYSDKRLTWGPLLKRKNKINEFIRFFLNSKILLQNKLLIYKPITVLISSYGITIWGPAKPLNIRPIQVFQSIEFRLLNKASWYVPNTRT